MEFPERRSSGDNYSNDNQTVTLPKNFASTHFHAFDAVKKFLDHIRIKMSANGVLLTTKKGEVQSLSCDEGFHEKSNKVSTAHISVFEEIELCFSLFYNDKTNDDIVANSYKWLQENGKYVESLLTTVIKLNRKLSNNEISTHNGIEGATHLQQEVLQRLTKLFEEHLLKRRVKQNSDDLWDTYGKYEFQRRLWYYVEHDAPLLFVLPAFPFKSSNLTSKVLGNLPDVSEKLALQRLEKFLLAVDAIYPPGAFLVIFSDGRVYCDQFRIDDETTTKFKRAVREIYPSDKIYWFDLDMFFPKFDDDGKRTALVNLFGTTPDVINKMIKEDDDFKKNYCGFKKFMTEELNLPKNISNKIRDEEIKSTAQKLMMRNYSYGNLMNILFPNHVRLSIHPSKCTTKFSVNLVGETDWGTPWHNCALLQSDGTWALIRRKTAEAKNYKLEYTEEGLPYFVNHTDEIFKENL